MSLDRIARDWIEVAQYLRDHLGKKKIIIIGHSWGSIVAIRMAGAKPDLFYAYVGTGQAGDEVRNYAAAFDALRNKARATNKAQALADLDRVEPQGAEDFTTATALAREYFDMIKAPRKVFVPIPDGGHFAVFIRSTEFLGELVSNDSGEQADCAYSSWVATRS